MKRISPHWRHTWQHYFLFIHFVTIVNGICVFGNARIDVEMKWFRTEKRICLLKVVRYDAQRKCRRNGKKEVEGLIHLTSNSYVAPPKCHLFPDLSLCFHLFRSIGFLSKLIACYLLIFISKIFSDFFGFTFLNSTSVSFQDLASVITSYHYNY